MRRLITLTLFLFSSHLWAESLVLGCGNSQPPYVIPQNDRGIALELMKRHRLSPKRKLLLLHR